MVFESIFYLVSFNTSLNRRGTIWCNLTCVLSKYFQAAHLEIESHGPLIKAVVQLCQQYSDKFFRSKKRKKRDRSQDRATATSSTGVTASDSCPTVSIGRAIEQRWHHLWLRSLEWQCFLEQLAWTSSKQRTVRVTFELLCFPLNIICILDLENYQGKTI